MSPASSAGFTAKSAHSVSSSLLSMKLGRAMRDLRLVRRIVWSARWSRRKNLAQRDIQAIAVGSVASFDLAVDIREENPAALREHHRWPDSEDALFGIGNGISVQPMVGELLQEVTVDPQPKVRRELVRRCVVQVEGLSRLRAARVLACERVVVISVVQIVKAPARFPLWFYEERKRIVRGDAIFVATDIDGSRGAVLTRRQPREHRKAGKIGVVKERMAGP